MQNFKGLQQDNGEAITNANQSLISRIQKLEEYVKSLRESRQTLFIRIEKLEEVIGLVKYHKLDE
jgi:hypothetical protein